MAPTTFRIELWYVLGTDIPEIWQNKIKLVHYHLEEILHNVVYHMKGWSWDDRMYVGITTENGRKQIAEVRNTSPTNINNPHINFRSYGEEEVTEEDWTTFAKLIKPEIINIMGNDDIHIVLIKDLIGVSSDT